HFIKPKFVLLSGILFCGACFGLYHRYGSAESLSAYVATESLYQALRDIRDSEHVSYLNVAEKLKRFEITLPDNHYAWAKLGDVYLNLQMYTEALNAYEKAEVFAAGDEVYFAKAQQAYALSFIHSGKLNEQALRLIDEVLSQYPSHRGALNL